MIETMIGTLIGAALLLLLVWLKKAWWNEPDEPEDAAKYLMDGERRLSRAIMMDIIYGPEKGRQMRIEELRKQGRWVEKN